LYTEYGVPQKLDKKIAKFNVVKKGEPECQRGKILAASLRQK
jgi:hypothetical protein